MPVLHVHIVT